MSRSNMNGMSDAQIMHCRLMNMIDYLGAVKGRPRSVKELAAGMDLIWPTSAYVASRDLKRLCGIRKCPSCVPYPKYKRAKGLALSVYATARRRKGMELGVGYVEECREVIGNVMNEKTDLKMHQAEIIRAARDRNFGRAVVIRSLETMRRDGLVVTDGKGYTCYYSLTEDGMKWLGDFL